MRAHLLEMLPIADALGRLRVQSVNAKDFYGRSALGAGAMGAGAMGACSRATQYDTQIAYVRVGRTRQKDMTRRTQDRVRIAPCQGI